MSTIETALAKLRSELPPVFNITEVDRLTGGALRRRTLANMRSRGDVPESVFIKEGSRKVLLVRDELLPWWGSRLTPVTNSR